MLGLVAKRIEDELSALGDELLEARDEMRILQLSVNSWTKQRIELAAL